MPQFGGGLWVVVSHALETCFSVDNSRTTVKKIRQLIQAMWPMFLKKPHPNFVGGGGGRGKECVGGRSHEFPI